MTQTTSKAHYTPWRVDDYEGEKICIMNALEDVVCVSQGVCKWQDRRDFNAIVEMANAR